MPCRIFLIAYRRINIPQKKTTSSTQLPHQQDGGRKITQILVRKSANGTSKYGVGSGVPATISTVDRDHHRLGTNLQNQGQLLMLVIFQSSQPVIKERWRSHGPIQRLIFVMMLSSQLLASFMMLNLENTHAISMNN